METLKNNRRFSFLYDGKEITDADYSVSQTQEGNQLTTCYTFADGLKITNILTCHEEYNAYEWVNYLENTSNEPSKMISELWDCDITLPMLHEEPYKPIAWKDWDATVVYAPAGCCDSAYEFYFKVDDAKKPIQDSRLFCGQTKKYAPIHGKSSWMQAPFFNIHKGGMGYIVAVGWTGQWNCQLTRGAEDVTIQTKIQDTEFYMMPGERFRTSSVVIMPYECDVIDSQNKWRRLVKDKYSLIGKPGREEYAPLSCIYWGGAESHIILDGIQKIKENEIPYDYLWIDAGWYGIDNPPSPDDYEGSWGPTEGDWRVSPLIHPNGLKDVSEAIHEAGMKFLLWMEIEGASKEYAPICKEHPEYFLDIEKKYPNLNLGDEKARNYIFELLSDKIVELGIDCFRQDANGPFYCTWRSNDREGRKGITEIKYINGLYALWDSLLERFPHLLIDNCASGGKRIDIETLRRSVPLWRSDSATAANYKLEGMQNQQLGYNAWMPYSGGGTGRVLNDVYRIRSAYSGSMATAYTIDSRVIFGKTQEEIDFVKKYCSEYLKVRPYFYEDFYPLTQMSDSTDVWCGSQFHRPKQNDGIVQLFRREDAPYETARFDLRAIEEDAIYCFTDADDDSSFTISGKELKEKGFVITLPQKRTAKIYFYKTV